MEIWDRPGLLGSSKESKLLEKLVFLESVVAIMELIVRCFFAIEAEGCSEGSTQLILVFFILFGWLKYFYQGLEIREINNYNTTTVDVLEIQNNIIGKIINK